MPNSEQTAREAEVDRDLRPPTRADYDQAERKLQSAYDATEALAWRLAPFDGLSTRSRQLKAPPTLVDVGALWSFIDDLELQVDQLGLMKQRLINVLGELNVARIEAEEAERV